MVKRYLLHRDIIIGVDRKNIYFIRKWNDGVKCWLMASVSKNIKKEFEWNTKYHNLHGPAIVWTEKMKSVDNELIEYYIKDKKYSYEEWQEERRIINENKK